MGIFDLFKQKPEDSTEKNNNEEKEKDWISFIEQETESDFENPDYELIQHKTDFYNKDVLVFSGWELIIEIYSNEEFEANIYPNLVCGDTTVIKGNTDNPDYETFIIKNHPYYDYQELTNGLSRIAEGNIEAIANALNSFKTIDYNILLPLDKFDFTYFDYFSSKSYLEIKTASKNNNKATEYISQLIGAEVYAYDKIMSIDKEIKRKLDYDKYIMLQMFIEEGYDKFKLPENLNLVKDSFGKIDHSSRENASLLTNKNDEKVFNLLEKKYNKDAHHLYWFTTYKDYELPDKDIFLKDNNNEIKKLKSYLKLFSDFNYPSYKIILNKLYGFNCCIWEIYPNIADEEDDDNRNIFEELRRNDYPRIKIKEYDSADLYESNLKKEEEKESEELVMTINTSELNKDFYKEFHNKLYSILEKEQEKESQEKAFYNLSENHFNKGIKKYNEKKWGDAIFEFNDCIATNPNKDLAYYNRALCKCELNHMQSALIDLEKAINLCQTEPNFIYMRGLIKDDLDDKNAALEDYNKCIELDNNYIPAYLNRASIKSSDGDSLDAIADYNHVIKIDNDNFKATLGKAIVYDELTDYDSALISYLKVIKLDKEYSYAYKRCAEIYLEDGDLKKAKYYADKYINLEPNDDNFKKSFKS